jgi:hypothetical protein
MKGDFLLRDGFAFSRVSLRLTILRSIDSQSRGAFHIVRACGRGRLAWTSLLPLGCGIYLA